MKRTCIRFVGALLLVAASAGAAHGLIHFNFDQDIIAAPIGIPFVRVTATIYLDGTYYLYGGTGFGSTTSVWATPSFTLGPDPNETNSTTAARKFKEQIGNLPGWVPGGQNIPVTWGFWHLTNWDLDKAAGYPGWINASGSFEDSAISDTYRINFYHDTQPGSSARNPMLPDSINLQGGFEFSVDLGSSGSGRDFPLFFDPAVAIGYRYSVGEGDPNFAIVHIPSALPGGDGQFELNLGGEVYPLSAGVPFDITRIIPGGVAQFSITGIDPEEALDPTNPTAFVTGLTFVGEGMAVNVTMTPISEVPEPATFLLLTSCLTLLLIGRPRPRG